MHHLDRPSAEKLLQNHFFKQTKRKEFLIKSVLSKVKPLNERPHKKVPQQTVAVDTCEQWDFDTPSDSKRDTPPPTATAEAIAATATATAAATTPTSTPTTSTPTAAIATETVTQATPERNGDLVAPTPKKHISFGDVVIKDPSARLPMSPVAESPPTITSTTSPAPPALAKKSRFVVEESESQSSSPHPSPQQPVQSPTSAQNTSHSATDPTALTGVGLGISANSHASQDGEVKKGRFSVNQTPQSRPSTPADGSDSGDKSVQHHRPSMDDKPVSICRVSSQDSLPGKFTTNLMMQYAETDD